MKSAKHRKWQQSYQQDQAIHPAQSVAAASETKHFYSPELGSNADFHLLDDWWQQISPSYQYFTSHNQNPCHYNYCIWAFDRHFADMTPVSKLAWFFFFLNHKFSGNIPFLRIPNINAYNKQTFSPMKTTMPTASLELHICEHRGQYNIYLCPWDEVVKDGHNKIPITSLASSQLNKRAEMSLLKIKCFDSCGKPTQNLKGWLPLPMGPWDIVHHHDSQKRYAI